MRPSRLVFTLTLGLAVTLSCAARDKGAATPEATAGPASGAYPPAQGYRPEPPPAGPVPPAATSEAGGSALAQAGDTKKDDSLELLDDPKLTKLEQAQKALEGAEQALAANTAPSTTGVSPPAQKPIGSKKPAPAATSTQPDDASAVSAGQPRCENACKAFESLRRAAGAVCRIAGNDDARCTRAKDVVRTNESRVAVCKCNGSGG